MLAPMKALSAMKKAANASELTPELTDDAINTTQVLLPVFDDREGVTMEFIDGLDPESIPLSRLEKLLTEMEGMKTTHLGYIYVFPPSHCTNKPVQTDISLNIDATALKTEPSQDISTQAPSLVSETYSHLLPQSDSTRLSQTSKTYQQSVSTTTSVTTNKEIINNNTYLAEESSSPTLLSAEVQTDPLSQLPSLKEYLRTANDGDGEKIVDAYDTDPTRHVVEHDITMSGDDPSGSMRKEETELNKDEPPDGYAAVSTEDPSVSPERLLKSKMNMTDEEKEITSGAQGSPSGTSQGPRDNERGKRGGVEEKRKSEDTAFDRKLGRDSEQGKDNVDSNTAGVEGNPVQGGESESNNGEGDTMKPDIHGNQKVERQNEDPDELYGSIGQQQRSMSQNQRSASPEELQKYSPQGSTSASARTASPTRKSIEPSQRSASPTQRSESSSQRSPSPTQRSASPMSVSPTQRSASPTQRSASPTQRSASSPQRSTQRSASPTQRSASPTQKSTQRLASPRSASQTQRSASPTQRSTKRSASRNEKSTSSYRQSDEEVAISVQSQTIPISTDDKCSQSTEVQETANQTDTIKLNEKVSSTDMMQSNETQTDAVVVVKKYTQIPDVSEQLSQTEETESTEHGLQTEPTKEEDINDIDESIGRDRIPRTKRQGLDDGNLSHEGSQTDPLPTQVKHSQTEIKATQGNSSQTIAQPVKNKDSQTSAAKVKDTHSQTEVEIEENVNLASAPGRKGPKDGTSAMSECESQTDLTQEMMMNILQQTSLLGRETESKLLNRGSGHDASGNKRADHETVEVEAEKSQSDEVDMITKHSTSKGKGRKSQRGKLSQTGDLTPGKRREEKKYQAETFEGKSEENGQLSGFLDDAGESTFTVSAAGGAKDRMDSVQEFTDDDSQSVSPDGASPDDGELSTFVASGDQSKERVGKNVAIVGSSTPSGKGSTSKSRQQLMSGKAKSLRSLKSQASGKGVDLGILPTERSTAAAASGDSSADLLIARGVAEGEEESADPSVGAEQSPVTPAESTIQLKRTRKLPVVIKYTDEEDEAGNLFTNICRCCLPPYVLFLLLLALACLLSLLEPDNRCCFENHYPSTFGIMMTYPNGPPPI